VSCASAGNCAAGGNYADRSGDLHGFVVSERHGVWGNAIEVPGLKALNAGGRGHEAGVWSVSCASAGGCAAGGFYFGIGKSVDGQGFVSLHGQGFVVSERRGVWGKAIAVPGRLAAGGFAEVFSVSCALAGNCAAAGVYAGRSGHGQGFVVSERHGVWGKAMEIPGLGALNTGADVGYVYVSCASAGNCAADGNYADRSGNSQGFFVASERHGVWGNAVEVPGLKALNAGGLPGIAQVTAVSCAPDGDCAAGGSYIDRSGKVQGFVVTERHGAWGDAVEVPGLGALNAGGFAQVLSVSCAPAGPCAADGFYHDRSYRHHWFVVSQRNRQ
jgi:hypothetical protein